MKTIGFSILFAALTLCSLAQDFTWMKGSNISGQSGIYGTMGSPATANNPGGRHGCGQWTDQAGNLWIFGGEGYSTLSSVSWLNDLWKYDMASGDWTWIRGSSSANQTASYGLLGVPAAGNDPGAREFSVTWTDNNGKFWMFGGDGYDASSFGRLGDLWRYDPATNLWTWIKGPNSLNQFGVYGTQGVPATTNMPGARFGAAHWVDAAGDLWLYGGRGYAASGFAGFLNDLWRYNIASNMWTWMSGSSSTSQPGAYGTQGVPSVTNNPGAKEFPFNWTDAQGNLYLLGGRGTGYFNDLWKYDPLTNAWTWLKGANTANQAGIYGTLGTSAPANTPGGRFSGASWSDQWGNFWLFGGQGWSATTLNHLNDLWRYNPCTNEWTWMKGSNAPSNPGVYGSLGVPNAANVPGARFYTMYWTDPQKDFWLFGGEGYDSGSPAIDHLNDLWKYNPVPDADTMHVSPKASVCSGQQAVLTAYGSANATTSWSMGASPLGTGTSVVSPILTAASNPTVFVFTAAVSCSLRPNASVQVTVYPNPTVSISGSDTLCNGSVAGYTAAGASNYTWSNSGLSAVSNFTAGTSNFTLGVTGEAAQGGCTSSATFSVVSLSLPVLSIAPTKTVYCRANPSQTAVLTASGASSYTWVGLGNSSSVSIPPPFSNTVQTQTVVLHGVDANGCVAVTSFSFQWVFCISGVNESSAIQELEFFPNPSNGTIQFRGEYNGPARICVYSMLGQEVYRQELQPGQSLISPQLPAGQYLVRLLCGQGRYRGRIIIE